MIVIILGGIYGGIFTPTEASAVAVVYGFFVSFFIYRELKLEDLPKILLNTASLTGVVMVVLGMASMFSFVLTFDRLPHLLAQQITAHALDADCFAQPRGPLVVLARTFFSQLF